MKKLLTLFMSLLLSVTMITPSQTKLVFAEEKPDFLADVNVGNNTVIGSVESAAIDGHKVTLTLSDGNKTQFTFLNDNLFRYYVDIKDETFLDYPVPNAKDHEGLITVQKDNDFASGSGVIPTMTEDEDKVVIKTKNITLEVAKATSMLTVLDSKGKVALKEAGPIMYDGSKTTQSLTEMEDEYFYGAGMQNGRFSHKNEIVKAARDNNWVDGGVTSPNPFYWTTKGYGIMRNTFRPGTYDFGKTNDGVVSTSHDESRFDAYVMIGEKPESILDSYTDLTGKPAHQPDYSFYLAHLNCYNRDIWKETGKITDKLIDGKYYSERQPGSNPIQPGELLESLMPKNGNDAVTAKMQIDLHERYDMPLGSFYPNDGYGCGYGQSDTFEGDIAELRAFSDFANGKGVEVGLWTQAKLWPNDINNPKKGERDVKKEVEKGGVRATKTDVAWVGAGYSMALDGIMKAYEAITELGKTRAMIVSLNGWAGSQKYAGMWSGDQYGGAWEYIRFHIPTYIGTGLSGMPYLGSDMDGIFGGKNPIVQTRDFQWKAFTPQMLDMDGWGSSQKNPWEFSEMAGINRAYLKLKAEMMPYISTMAKRATETGMPLVRAMMLEYPNEGHYVHSKATQYQYMWGDSLLVAPIYQNTASDKAGNDIRNDIYLPDSEQIWIDYFTGDQYRGGSVLNNFEAPIWKTPVFVKNGAIIPMYSENNNPQPITASNPMGTDKSNRIVEFYPNGTTSAQLYEDDGMELNGGSTLAIIDSVVSGSKATLSVSKTTGSYTGFVKNRDTEFIVNVSEAPQSVNGTVKGEAVEFVLVDSREAYDAATGNVYFYDESPVSIINKYNAETDATHDVKTSPKLFVKANEKVDVSAYGMSVEIDGFKNEQSLASNEVVEGLEVPTNLASGDITPSKIELTWDKVTEAVSYDIEIDGTIFSNITKNEFTHSNLNYDTDYSYRVRTVNEVGHSEWSEILVVRTSLDPYRNVPSGMTATWSAGDAYSGTPADTVDNDDASFFHSKNSGDALKNTFTIDMQRAYPIEKFEYLSRPDFGNGTIKRFKLESSLDGQNWKEVVEVGKDVPAWTYSKEEANSNLKTLNFEDTFTARYLKLSVLESVGGFLTAHEFRPYTTDKNKGQIVGDWNNSEDIDEGDLTFFENYAGLRDIDADFGGYVEASDINYDGVIDAYDISYVARMLRGGVQSKGKNVQGKMFVVPSVEEAEAGEEVTYTVYGLGMENVYAMNIEFPYDNDAQTFVANKGSVLTQFMTSFSKHRMHSNDQWSNYLIFTNVGNQKLIDGTGVIGSFTMKQVVEGSTALEPLKANFVGDNLSVVDALMGSETPVLPDTQATLTLDDIKALTFTNDLLPTDDGTNGAKLWQQANYASLLFDGNKTGPLAEYKWYIEPDSIAEYVKLPTTIHIELKEEQPVTFVRVHNRASSNGAVTSIKAQAFSGETVYDLGQFDKHQSVFEFELPSGVLVDRIEITPLTSVGNATGVATGSEKNRMLSLHEIEIATNSEVAVESIEFAENTPTEIALDSLQEIVAKVNPAAASNPFYEITSSDSSILSVTEVKNANGYKYFVTGNKAGTVTLTATARGDESKTVTKEVTVTDSYDTTLLEKAIAEAEALHPVLYTQETLDELNAVLAEAKAVLANPESANKVQAITMKLNVAISQMKLKGSNTDQVDSENLIDSDLLAIESFSNFADQDVAENILDKDEKTVWHTSYQSGAKLPVNVVLNLNGVYDLDQINFLPNTKSRNGDITRYRIEVSMDNVNFEPVVEGLLPYDAGGLLNRSSYQKIKFDTTKAQYVKFIALESLGENSNADRMNRFAAMSEIQLFGVLDESNPITAIEFELESLEMVLGESATPSVLVSPEAHSETVVWTSSDDSIATVDQNGEIKSHKLGQVTITASNEAGDIKDSILVKIVAPSVEALEALVAETTLLTENEDYMNALPAVLKDALLAAQETATDLLALYAETPEAVTTEQINSAFAQLTLAVENLDYALDIKALEELANMDLSAYDTTTTAQFKALQTEAKELLKDLSGRLEDVVALNEKLHAAKDTMVLLDSAQLTALIDLLESYDLSEFTKASANALTQAIEDAKAVKTTATTNAAYTESIDTLKAAHMGLQKAMTAAQKETLNTFLDRLKDIDYSEYKESTAKEIKAIEALVKAHLELEDPSWEATLELMVDVKYAEKLIQNPDKNDTPPVVVNKEALNTAIKAAQALTEKDYTVNTWDALQKALNGALIVSKDTDATQDTVDQALETLNNAVKNLVLAPKDPVNPTDPVDPTDPVEPGEGTNPTVTHGFMGLPETVRVGDTFTLKLKLEAQEGATGWSYDKEFFAATFTDGATFAALKEGKTTITYTDAQGNKQTADITILKAIKHDDTDLVPVGITPNHTATIAGGLAIALGAVVLVMKKKREEEIK